MGADTTKRVVDNASEELELRCRQKMHDEEEVDDDEEDEIDITTFIDMIKMIFTTRWSDIYNELLLQWYTKTKRASDANINVYLQQQIQLYQDVLLHRRCKIQSVAVEIG